MPARARAAERGGGSMDVFGGEIRRRDLFPLLVLHLIDPSRSTATA